MDDEAGKEETMLAALSVSIATSRSDIATAPLDLTCLAVTPNPASRNTNVYTSQLIAESNRREAVRTAMMLTNPMMKMTIPEPMTNLQKVMPSDFLLVASLFKLPRMLFPRTTIASPRKLNPWAGLSKGQSLAKKFLKIEHSDVTRNTCRC